MDRHGLIEWARQRARRLAIETRTIFEGLTRGGHTADGIFARLRHQHHEIERLLDQLGLARDEEERRDRFTRLRIEVLVHRHVEEYVLYPALEDHDATQFLVEQSEDEHAAIEELLEDMRHAAGVDRDEHLEQLRLLLRDHMRREETELFPRAHEVLSRAQIEGLAETFDFELRTQRQFFQHELSH